MADAIAKCGRTRGGAGPAARPHGFVDLSARHGGDEERRATSPRRSRWAGRGRGSGRSAKTVLSFGAPLLDGWGTPGNVIAARAGFRLIQAEAVESRTASPGGPVAAHQAGLGDGAGPGIASVLGGGSADYSRGQGGGGHGLTRTTDRGCWPASWRTTARRWCWTLGILRRSGAQHAGGRVRRHGDAARNAGARGMEEGRAGDGSGRILPDGSVRVLLIDESAPGEYHSLERDREEAGGR